MERVFGLLPRLHERRDQAAGTLSGGEQQMLAVARALMSDARTLLLDEPSMGLAPKLVKEVYKVIRDINETGVTILLVEQNANLGAAPRPTGGGPGKRENLIDRQRCGTASERTSPGGVSRGLVAAGLLP